MSKALHKDRDKRYQATRDLLIDLRSLKLCLEFEEELERSVPPARGEIKGHRRGSILTAVTLVLVIATLCYVFFFRTSPTNSEVMVMDSIAVLPLVNAGNDPATEYLSDGITESLINSLSQVQQLRVVARTTAFRYKGRETDPQQVGRDLGVRAVLTGRLIQRGDNLGVQVDLVETGKGSQAWGEHYDRKASNLLAVRQELAREIAGKLRLRLGVEDEKRLAKGDTANAEAYQSYLRGRHFFNRRTAADIKNAIEYFQQAIDKDLNYALAYVGLADCYGLLEEYAGVPTSEILPKARAALERALQIDDSLGEGVGMRRRLQSQKKPLSYLDGRASSSLG